MLVPNLALKMSKGSLAIFILKNVILNTLDSVTDVASGVVQLYCGEFQLGVLLLSFPFFPGLAIASSFLWSSVKGDLSLREALKSSGKYLAFPLFHLYR